MSRIDDLIAEHCPDGVEFKRLGDIVRIKNGKDHKSLGDGEFPVYGSGGIMRYADTYAYNKPSVLIPRKGSLGNLFFVDVPFWTVDTIFYTEINEAQVCPKYLYYFLTTVGLGEMKARQIERGRQLIEVQCFVQMSTQQRLHGLHIQ